MKGLIFTYLLTYGGALASLVNPFTGLLIYVLFAIVNPQAMWYWSVPEGNYSRIVAVAMLIGWAIHGFGNWRLGRGRGIMLAFVGFWLWGLLSALSAQDTLLSLEWVEWLAKVLLPFLVGMTVVDSVEKLKQLAWVIMLSEGYIAFEMNLGYYAGFNRVQEIGFAGLDNNGVAIAMVSGTGLAFFLGLSANKTWQKAVALAAAVLMVHTIMFSFSRGGMVALILTAVVSFFLVPKTWKHYLAFAAFVLIGVRLAGKEVLERFATSFAEGDLRDKSAQGRLDLWADCWDVMQRFPILGVGPDHWPLIAPEYGWPLGKEAHSLWFQTGAEQGFPGVLFLLAFYGLCILRLWPLTRGKASVSDPWLCDAARMVIASIAGFMFAAQFVSLEGLELPYYVTLIGAGVLKLHSSLRQVPVLSGAQIKVQLPSFVHGKA